MLKLILCRLRKTIVVLLRLALYSLLLLTFMLIIGTVHEHVLRLSRTMVILVVGFVLSGLLLANIYGGYDIGKRKSKPIIFSLVLAVLFTDLIAFFELMIMNVNPDNKARLTVETVDLVLLLLIYLVQILWIVLFTYAGNEIYFRLVDPESCCVITGNPEELDRLLAGIRKFRLQYRIDAIKNISDTNIDAQLLIYDTIFLHCVPESYRNEMIRFCYRTGKNVYYNPEVEDIVEINARFTVMNDVPVIAAAVKEISTEQLFIKRLIDLAVSAVGLVVYLPIFLFCAIAIKLDDGGSIFFLQQRVTRRGKIFNIYKLRTMHENVENRSVTTDDGRITRVGRVLRKYRLDEFPQLLNVFKGDMSLVGPRPEMLENIDSYTRELPEFRYRQRVKAGITGYAQILGKYSTAPKDKLMMDLQYIEHFSLWQDMRLLFQTLLVLFTAGDSTEAFDSKYDSKIR